MSDTSGPTFYAPLGKWDHASQSWKTSEATSLWALTLSSLTLPTWGGLRDGELFEHPTPELRISGLDYSSLPTPTGDDANNVTRDSGAFQSLTRSVQMLPTPTSQAAKHGETPDTTANAYGKNLWDLPQLLPTPAVNDMGEGKTLEWWDDWAPRQMSSDGRPAPHGRSLAIEAMRMLPTPATANSKSTRAMTASTENGRRSGGGQSSPPGLEELASILSGHWPDHMPPMEELPPATLRSLGATTAPPSSDGSPLPDDPHPHQLNLDGLAHPA
jgi:hypothetical protein